MGKNNREVENGNILLTLLLSWIIIVTLIIALSGCSPARQLQRINEKHPAAAASFCASQYPPVIGEPTVLTHTDTVLMQVNRDCDSLAEAIAAKHPGIDLHALIDSLKGYKIQTEHHYTTDSVFVPVRDSALVAELTLKIDQLATLLEAADVAAAKTKAGRNVLLYVLIGIVVVSAVSIYFLLRSLFSLK